MLGTEGARRVGQIGAADTEHLADRRHEAPQQGEHSAHAETYTEADVARDAHVLVPVLLHPLRTAHDEAHEHVAARERDAPRVERRERHHGMGGRAERVVLVTVLHVDDAVPVVEERGELDPGVERGAVGRRRMRQGLEEEPAELLLHAVPVELDVVVAADDRDRMAVGDEAGELGEDVSVTLRDASQLEACVILGGPDAVPALLLGERRREGLRLLAAKIDHHPRHVDEVARDDDLPAPGGRRLGAVMGDETDQVSVDARAPALHRAGVVEIAAEVDVGEDQQALLGRSHFRHRAPLDRIVRSSLCQARQARAGPGAGREQPLRECRSRSRARRIAGEPFFRGFRRRRIIPSRGHPTCKHMSSESRP